MTIAAFAQPSPKSSDFFSKLLKVGGEEPFLTQNDFPELSPRMPYIAPWLRLGEGQTSSHELIDSLLSPTFEVTLPIPVIDQEIQKLEEAAQAGKEQAFIKAASEMDWSRRYAADYVKVVRLALSAGAHRKARLFAMEGAQRFPDHAEMQKYAHVLAPPKIIRTNLPPDPAAVKDMQWLKAHHDEYHGQWVALFHGELLGAAPTLKELMHKIENPIGKNVLVTPVY